MALAGDIDVDSLLLLPHLHTISFMNNNFEGGLPDFKKLGSLKSLFLSHNHFSGQIPDDAFMGMGSLKKLYLSDNESTGTIPSSVAHLNKLLEYPRQCRRGTPNSFQKMTILIDLPEEYKMIVDLLDSF
ncbi:Pollen receptor-like kinase 1 [Camellia lanceoleosa]|uniref:Pollen receptor-like kinase 1 n=1 Tax=Camellia lanceoleosa TaxID=1840588 RepID=A0ACC0HJF4_9ERIC|nr:Pollen receptor-like kinase 1 [Camellia lanceoleosa]